jgi:hypothetical protein
MFIKLHHHKSGQEFYIPASHIVIIDGVERDELSPSITDAKRVLKIKMTHIHTIISKSQNTLTFEVRESPAEVATLVNEMLHGASRASAIN